MVHYKTKEEIELIRLSSLLVARSLGEVSKIISPGITTLEIDKLVDTYIRDNGGLPVFKGYNGFPGSACISINEEVVHGIPGDKVLKEGDIVSVDIGVKMNGYIGDSAYTFPIGEISNDKMDLLRATKVALDLAIKESVSGNRIGDIGFAVQNYIEVEKGYHVVRDLVGHGVGKHLHEKPEVPNYGKRGRGMLLREGLVIAIEPMVNYGTRKVFQERDGWTIVTADKSPSAHYEHTIAVQKGKAEVLTSFKFIEEVAGSIVE